MCDTLFASIDIRTLNPNIDYLSNLRNAITVKSEGFNYLSNYNYFNGKHRNFIIEVQGPHVTIKGSLAKYFKGENYSVMTPQEIKLALKRLSKNLGIPVEKFTLTRVDIGECFFLNEPPKKYIDCLINIDRAETYPKKGTKYFIRSRQTLAFYDKMKELQKKDPATYTWLRRLKGNSNLLRYELRFTSKLSTIFKLKKIKVVHLYSSNFLARLAQEWINHYKMINKVKIENIVGISTVKDLERLLVFQGLKSHGNIEDSIKWIDATGKSNGWNAMTMSRAKRRAKEILNNHFLVTDSYLINELNYAIANSKILEEFVLNKTDCAI
jgi:hypothetical protein